MLKKTPTDEIVTDLYEQAEDGTCPPWLAKKSAKHIRAQEAAIKRLRDGTLIHRDEVQAMLAAERERCVSACVGEHLEGPLETEGDRAYQRGIDDCVIAIRALDPQEQDT